MDRDFNPLVDPTVIKRENIEFDVPTLDSADIEVDESPFDDELASFEVEPKQTLDAKLETQDANAENEFEDEFESVETTSTNDSADNDDALETTDSQAQSFEEDPEKDKDDNIDPVKPVLDGSDPSTLEYVEKPSAKNRSVAILNPMLMDKFVIPNDYVAVDSPTLRRDTHDDVNIDITEPVTKLNPAVLERLFNEEVKKERPARGYVSTQVVALISGYYCRIGSLSTEDLLELGSLTDRSYVSMRKIYETMYRCILTHSRAATEKLTFTWFLNNTAVNDIESIYAGVYFSTWPGKNEYQVRCNKCGQTSAVYVDNSALVKYATPEVVERVDNVMVDRLANPSALNGEGSLSNDLARLNLLNTRWTVKLPRCKAVVQLRIPTLAMKLRWHQRNADWESADKARSALIESTITNLGLVQTSMTIDNVRRNVVLSADNPSHWNILNRFITTLDPDDFAYINHRINKLIDRRFGIKYSIDRVKCSNPKCGNIIEHTPLDMEQVLFRAVSSRAMAL
jgi:hypothetical protein